MQRDRKCVRKNVYTKLSEEREYIQKRRPYMKRDLRKRPMDASGDRIYRVVRRWSVYSKMRRMYIRRCVF